jgi:hypothetical protein
VMTGVVRVPRLYVVFHVYYLCSMYLDISSTDFLCYLIFVNISYIYFVIDDLSNLLVKLFNLITNLQNKIGLHYQSVGGR